MENTITLEEIYERLVKLEDNFTKLKEWSDLNDYWLREMVDDLTENVNKLLCITEEEVGGPYHYKYEEKLNF